MALSLLEQAKKQFAKKKYIEVISLLQPHIFEYKDSFEYHLYLGLSFMHTGEIAHALDYFSAARKIKLTDPILLSAQGTLFLRKGNTNRAVDYYLQALSYAPNCRTAKKGLEFLRHHNTPEEIGDFIQSGRIKKLYPDPTLSYKKNRVLLVGLVSFVIVLFIGIITPIIVNKINASTAKRKELPTLILESADKKEAIQLEGEFSKIMTKNEVIKTYEKALRYFQKYRDNLAQYEVNRLLQSNASSNIKQKAQILSEYFETPGFDTIKDAFEYKVVAENPADYINCYVVWTGMPANIEVYSYNTLFELLVGYDSKAKLEGNVRVICPFTEEIDTEIPITVLGKVEIKHNELYLSAVSIYQSAKPLNSK